MFAVNEQVVVHKKRTLLVDCELRVWYLDQNRVFLERVWLSYVFMACSLERCCFDEFHVAFGMSFLCLHGFVQKVGCVQKLDSVFKKSKTIFREPN